MAEQRTLLLILLMGALAAVSFWLLQRQDNGDTGNGQGVLGNADYSMTQFTLTTMDEEGATQYRLNSAQLIHYQGEETAQFEQPDVTIYGSGEPVWHIRSDQGELVGSGDEVHLLGKVRITKVQGEQARPPVTIDTRNLYLYPDAKLATTEEHVEISQVTGTMTGTGMRAHLADQKFELLSNVKGIYEPPPTR